MNQPRLQSLYEIVTRANGKVLSHWITTSCIEAMSHAHKLSETRRDFYDDDPRLTIGLFSSMNHCNDIPELVNITYGITTDTNNFKPINGNEKSNCNKSNKI